jgi:parvulin-like peptidyl-prolyl isomerase
MRKDLHTRSSRGGLRLKQTFILLLAGFFLVLVSSIAIAQGASTQDETQTGSETIAAVVNGEVINKDELATAAGLNSIFQVLFTQFLHFGQVLLSTPEGEAFLRAYQLDVLHQIIDSRLLVQKAIEEEIEVDEATVEERVEGQLDQIMEQNQLTLEEIDGILKQQGSSLDEYKERLRTFFREQLLVQGLHEKIVQDTAVSDEEIATYYEEHGDEFALEDGSIPPLTEVQDQIRKKLLSKIGADTWEAWFSEAKEEAEIRILF